MRYEDPEHGAKAAKKLAEMYSKEKYFFGPPISLKELFSEGVNCMKADPAGNRDYEFLEMAAKNDEPTAALWYGNYLFTTQGDQASGMSFLLKASSTSIPEIAGEAALVIAQYFERRGLEKLTATDDFPILTSIRYYTIAAIFGYHTAISTVRGIALYGVSILEKRLLKNLETEESPNPETIKVEIDLLTKLSDDNDSEVAGAASKVLANYYLNSGLQTQTTFFGLITTFDPNAESAKFSQKYTERTGKAIPAPVQPSITSDAIEAEKRVVAEPQIMRASQPERGILDNVRLKTLHSRPNFTGRDENDDL